MKVQDLAGQKLRVANRRLARKLWGSSLSTIHLLTLAQMSQEFGFCIAMGDLLLLQGHWYVTHLGLVRLACRRGCCGIHIKSITQFCEAKAARWCFRATVYKSYRCKGFIGYGDADPSNISPLLRGAEMRIAETRAVNRALRKAFGIGICSLEELGSFVERAHSQNPTGIPPQPVNGNYGGPRVRDRLCQLIRQHQLDPNLVKAYAIDFCETKTLREASRERVENFVAHLADLAEKDRNSLVCQLNSYLPGKGSAA